jgi:hypothetical protein
MTNRLCKDCKFSKPYSLFGQNIPDLFGCARPDFHTGFPIGTPLEKERKKYGFFERHNRCGPEAKYFEPKETEAEKVV